MNKIIVLLVSVLLFLSSCKAPAPVSNQSSESTDTGGGAITSAEFDRVYGMVMVYAFIKYLLPEFKENQTVPIDNLLLYFELTGLTDQNGDTLEQWKPYEKSDDTYEIPKKKIKDYLETRFAVAVDDSKSQYSKGNLLKVHGEGRDMGPHLGIDGFEITGNRIVVRGTWSEYDFPTKENPAGKEGYYLDSNFELCIENYNASNYKYIYYKSEKWKTEL